jgi:hypothetical protein
MTDDHEMDDRVRRGASEIGFVPNPRELAENLAKEDGRLSVEEVRDMVVMPNHYARFRIEPIHFIQENGLSPLQGKVVKYIVRYPFKNGAEDIKKAIRCAQMLLKKEQGDPDWWKAPQAKEA